MGFYVRKSISVGPFRFNLSGSGIGISTGVPGLRVGAGPKGKYIHMGRDGLYYRQKINLPSVAQNEINNDKPLILQPTTNTHGPMMPVGTQSINGNCETSSMAILNEIQEKARMTTWWPVLAILSFFAFLGICVSELPDTVKFLSLFIFSVPVFILHQFEIWRKTIVLMYDLDEKHEAAFTKLLEAITYLSICGGKWRIIATGDVLNKKYHAGASYLVNRAKLEILDVEPDFIKTNVPIQKMNFGGINLFFMPDVVLVYSDSGKITAIDYDNLIIDHSQTNFTEEDPVPSDATIIGSTWRYINKDGGPDRRFNNNHKIPVCRYEEMRIKSKSGLDEILLVSKIGLSDLVNNGIKTVAKAINESVEAEKNRIANEISRRQNEFNRKSNDCLEQSDCDNEVSTELDPFDVLFHCICCVMASDGLASGLEKNAILTVMQKVKSNWSDEVIAKKLKAFLIDVAICGYEEILNRSIRNISIFKKVGREHVVINALNLVINADNKIDPREVSVLEKFKQALA